MASTKKNEAGIKQSTLLKWVKPDRVPSAKENENREETTSSIQANSNIKTTGQEPGLLAPADLASLSQDPNPPKNFNFPQKIFGNNTKKCPFQPAWFDQRQHENRMELFGKVTANNVPRKLSLHSKPNQTSD